MFLLLYDLPPVGGWPPSWGTGPSRSRPLTVRNSPGLFRNRSERPARLCGTDTPVCACILQIPFGHRQECMCHINPNAVLTNTQTVLVLLADRHSQVDQREHDKDERLHQGHAAM